MPGHAAPELPRVALPGVVARLSGPRHRVELPHLAARRLIECGDVAPHAVLAAPEARDDEILDHDRRRGDDRAARVVDDLALPQLLAGLGIQRDEMPVEPPHEDLAVGVGDSAIVDVTAGVLLDARRDLGRIPPFDLTRSRVGGEHVLWPVRRRHVEEVADQDGRRFLGSQRPELQRPGDLESADVRGVDLVQRAVARVGVVAAIHAPGRPRLRRDRRGEAGEHEGSNHEQRRERFHDRSPSEAQVAGGSDRVKCAEHGEADGPVSRRRARPLRLGSDASAIPTA